MSRTVQEGFLVKNQDGTYHGVWTNCATTHLTLFKRRPKGGDVVKARIVVDE